MIEDGVGKREPIGDLKYIFNDTDDHVDLSSVINKVKKLEFELKAEREKNARLEAENFTNHGLKMRYEMFIRDNGYASEYVEWKETK